MQAQFPEKINGGVVFSFFSFDMSVKKTNFAAEKVPPIRGVVAPAFLKMAPSIER